MVARSQVGGLSVEELAFLPDEIRELFDKIFNKTIDNQEAASLAMRTEGWITGLLLTTQMLKSGMGDQIKVSRASGIDLYDYLAQQVMEQQDKDVYDFMLNTSILGEFNAEMCDKVVGEALFQKNNWAAMLRHVIQHNLFVLPVDDEFTWIRYHHLFRDFLQTTIMRERPGDAKVIKEKLAEYYKEKEEWERVFDIYSELSDQNAITKLIERAGPIFINKGKINKLSEWLKNLSDDVIFNNPSILSMKASVATGQGNLQEGKDLLDKVIKILREKTDEVSLADNLIKRSSALRMLGDYKAAMQDAEEAIEITNRLPKVNHLYSEALRVKAVNLLQTGKLTESLKYYEQVIDICQRSNREQDVARVLVEMGSVYEKLGKYSLAENAYERSLTYWNSVSGSIWQSVVLNNLGVVRQLSGDFSNSFYNFEKAMHYAQATGNRRMEGYSLASIGDLYKCLDANKEAVEAYQKAMGIAQQVEDQYLIFYLKMARARMNLIERKLKKAEIQIRSAQSIVKKSGSSYEINKYRLEQAALDFSNKLYSKALEQLETTTSYFNEEGFVEDSVRSEVLQFLCLIKTDQKDQATVRLNAFMDRIGDPDRNIPSLAMLNELKQELTAFAGLKDYKNFFADISIQLQEYQASTQKNRRRIRKHASVVPFAPARFAIKAFNKAEVIVRDKTLAISDWKTQTSRDLFFLFLAHPEGLTKEEVGLIFWPDSSPAELKLRFKNAIYRMRHAVGSETVLFHDNFYQFNRSIDYEYDVQNFISAVTQSDKEISKAKKKSILTSATEIYSGLYLPDINEVWVVADRQKYLEMYLKVVEDLVDICVGNNEYKEGLYYCQQALKHDICNEEIFRMTMEIYAALGNKAAISKQYDICCQVLKKELNTEPSFQTQNLFEELIK